MLSSFFLGLNIVIYSVFHTMGVVTNLHPEGPVHHIVLIGVDGMSPDGIHNANTPHMDSLMINGSYSLGAQAVYPTKSSPNWASMIMGSPPKVHKIKSNRWKRKHLKGKRFCGGEKGISVPTIFRVIKESFPAYKTALFHDWGDFGRLVEPGICDKKENTKGPEQTALEAGEYIENEKPLFTFIHLDHVDGAGHRYGHGSAKYYQAVEEADIHIGSIINSIAQAGILDKTVIIISADHGGVGHGHGGKSPEEMTIPWIVKGPGIQQNHKIVKLINIYDTAPTIAHLLQTSKPECWTGEPILEIVQ